MVSFVFTVGVLSSSVVVDYGAACTSSSELSGLGGAAAAASRTRVSMERSTTKAPHRVTVDNGNMSYVSALLLSHTTE